MDSLIKIDGKEIKLTNLEKVYWPQDGYTKYDLIKYYTDISPFLLPHLEGRAANFQRFPHGIEEEGFYQKNCPSHAPSWIKRVPIKSSGRDKVTRYIMVEDLATLTWLANQGCLEIHPWLSSVGSLKHPDYAVFDLDPPDDRSFARILEVALLVKKVLDNLGLKSYPKTSGSTGLQIFVPLKGKHSYKDVRDFTGTLCGVIEKFDRGTTTERKVGDRKGRIYLDYLQNALGKTINAPYSVRPLKNAPVSTPLVWGEVEEGRVRPGDFTMETVHGRLAEMGDVFAAHSGQGQDIGPFLSAIHPGPGPV